MFRLDKQARGRIALIGFMLIGGFYLVTEHRAHLLGILPYLIFLACPLMHLFMHHGHGGHDGHGHYPDHQPRAPGRIAVGADASEDGK